MNMVFYELNSFSDSEYELDFLAGIQLDLERKKVQEESKEAKKKLNKYFFLRTS